jgi:hypothetical protein
VEWDNILYEVDMDLHQLLGLHNHAIDQLVLPHNLVEEVDLVDLVPPVAVSKAVVVELITLETQYSNLIAAPFSITQMRS